MEWLAEHARTISVLDAIVEASIAVVVALLVRRRLGRVPPLTWLVAAYFAFEALVSLSRESGTGSSDGALARLLVFELAGTLALVAILLAASHILDGLLALVDRARARAAEYERARHDYMQVVRHRINNPLTVIKGAAQTLETDIADDATRHRLRLAIIDAAQVLEEISLAPERRGGEEHELDAVAHVRDPGGA